MTKDIEMNDVKKNNLNPLIKTAATFLVLGGLLYILIQFIHPEENIDQVTSSMWLVVSILSAMMSLFIAAGILMSYIIQSGKINVLGHIGAILFTLFWIISMIFSFIEAFVLPVLSTTAPDFVSSMLALFGDAPATADLGIFPLLANISGAFYILGGLLYGLAMYRAKVFSKITSLVLSIAAILTVVTGFVPHPQDRIFAIPMGIALILLGISLYRIKGSLQIS